MLLAILLAILGAVVAIVVVKTCPADQKLITHIFSVFTVKIPEPYPNCVELKSSIIEFTNILSQIDGLLSQLSTFIEQYQLLITSNDIQVIANSDGDLSIDTPATMHNFETYQLSRRVRTYDSVILDRVDKIKNLIKEGRELEIMIQKDDLSFKSRILDKAYELRRLKNLHGSCSINE